MKRNADIGLFSKPSNLKYFTFSRILSLRLLKCHNLSGKQSLMTPFDQSISPTLTPPSLPGAASQPQPIGWWTPCQGDPIFISQNEIKIALYRLRDPLFVTSQAGKPQFHTTGTAVMGCIAPPSTDALPLLAWVPALPPESLGDPDFKKFYGIRYAYVAGAMAGGITSVEMVCEVVNAGMLGFFGAAGLSISEIDQAIHAIRQRVGDRTFGCNFIHSPNEPQHEMAVAQLYIDREVRLVSASAFLNLSLPIVYYRVKGIHQLPDGSIVCPNRIKAKVSRAEVARRFFSPPPAKLVHQLLERNLITRQEAELSAHIPMADDLTAEADSGGHTDNRPAITLLPSMIALRDQVCSEYRYARLPRVGLGGGISNPRSAAGAFAMGAAYILVGSVHQSCVESGSSDAVRKLLADAQQADVAMAPSADMFEMGVKVQVLKRGTMFALRANRLYDLYQAHDRYEDIPANQRAAIERDLLKASFEETWENTRKFFENRDPAQVTKALNDPKHRMALVFRSYLGLASRWATSGESSRVLDYQIWCGPAMGAFNEWVKGTFLEPVENRRVVTVALNLLVGAAAALRARWLMAQGIRIPLEVDRIFPMTPEEIRQILEEPPVSTQETGY